jgi:hypothetical protein
MIKQSTKRTANPNPPKASADFREHRLSRTIAPDLILVALLIAYFLHFALQSLPATT